MRIEWSLNILTLLLSVPSVLFTNFVNMVGRESMKIQLNCSFWFAFGFKQNIIDFFL